MTSPIRYIGWVARFDTQNFEVQGVGDTQSEALIMLRSAWAAHCERTMADPGFLDAYLDDVNYHQLVIPSGVVDGVVLTTSPTAPPIDAADFDNVSATGLDATQRGIPQNGA